MAMNGGKSTTIEEEVPQHNLDLKEMSFEKEASSTSPSKSLQYDPGSIGNDMNSRTGKISLNAFTYNMLVRYVFFILQPFFLPTLFYG